MTFRGYNNGKISSLKYWVGLIPTLLLLWIFTFQIHAQTTQPHITIDGSLKTLGGSGPQAFTGREVEITQEMGVTRVGNLFHSFGQFNVPSDHSVTFSGDPGVANILSRVTGGEVSSIDGMLASTIDNANLFLLNPAGLVFGSNAILDVNGAFYVSTADFIRLGQNNVFYASLEENSVLTSAAPEAFGFLGTTPLEIASTSSTSILVEGLESQNGHSITLVGRDTITDQEIVDGIVISGGTLQNPSGRVSLVSVDKTQLPEVDRVSVDIETLEVQGLSSEGNVTQEPVQLGATRLSNGAQIDVSGIEGGTVVIRGGRLTIDGAEILSNTRGPVEGTSEQTPKDAIDIESEAVLITNGGGISVGTFSSFDGGKVRLMATENIKINNGGFILTFTESDGDSGNIEINAGKVQLSMSSIESLTDLFEPLNSNSIGNSGLVELSANEIELNNVSSIFTQTSTSGKAGDIELNMTQGVLSILGGSDITTQSDASADGDSGNINVHAEGGTVIIGDRASSIFTAINGHGAGGSIQLRADNLELNNSASIGIQNSGPKDPEGITITLTGNLDMRNDSLIDSISRSPADAADLIITAKNINISDRSNLATESRSTGRGGNLNIITETLQLTDNSRISSQTRRSGDAGNIVLNVKDIATGSGAEITSRSVSEIEDAGRGGTIEIKAINTIDFTDSEISTSVAGGIKPGGNINLQANQIIAISDKTTVTAQSSGMGNAGNIHIRAGKTIQVDTSEVTTQSVMASGGDIKLDANNMIRLANSTIESSVQGNQTTAGGDINLDPQFVILQNSRILATATSGFGGNIEIVGDVVLADPFSLDPENLSATSEAGPQFSGDVDIRAPIQNLSETIAPLPEEILRVSGLFAARCAAQKGGKFSSFLQGGRDGTPPGATNFLPSPLTFSPSDPEVTTSINSGLGLDDRQTENEWKFSVIPHTADLAQGCSAVPASRS